MPGGSARTFGSVECATHALACEYRGVKVIGDGVEANGSFYRRVHHASMQGAEHVTDRV